jgi:4-hydroxy-3-polyprenylbenzoate decarboxylase
VDPSDFHAVLREVWSRFDPENDMWLLPFAPLDTLDFTSFTMHSGSKLIINAAGKTARTTDKPKDIDPRQFDRRILRYRLLEGGLLAIVVQDNVREVLANLVRAPIEARFVVAVSEDVQLDNDENLQWGIFTRFDPARDIVVTEQTFVGARPVYRGIVGIDATWKKGYPAPLVMDESIVKLVDRRWSDYWK